MIADTSLKNTTAAQLSKDACIIRDAQYGSLVSYSKKIFIPLTKLCRDVCHYCTFAQPPRKAEESYLSPTKVMEIAQAGSKQGCKEALFTLGERPELRYRAARDALAAMGFETTLDYLRSIAARVLEETDLIPHLNPGTLMMDELEQLKPICGSMGIMLESGSTRLTTRGNPHYGSPDKDPALRKATLENAGKLGIPMTTGLLVGIGETRQDRLSDLRYFSDLFERYGHIQEVIIQNFQPKPATRMQDTAPPSLEEICWTIAAARHILPPQVSIQTPPNLNPGRIHSLVNAGINDWGGISPVTKDHVNPEAPWPSIRSIERETRAAGKTLVERLSTYPQYVIDKQTWIDKSLHTQLVRQSDTMGFAHDHLWYSGGKRTPNMVPKSSRSLLAGSSVSDTIARLKDGEAPSQKTLDTLFNSRGDEIHLICEAANQMRREINGDAVTYVVNRNINYTNICQYRCAFCAFAKGKTSRDLRGPAYDLPIEEIVSRAREARDRGATEVCLQGGIHPKYSGDTYLNIVSAIHSAIPDIHIHAFSPLEVWQGAHSLGLPVRRFLELLREAGLSSLPGTAAEILDDTVREKLCPDKITTKQWTEVVRTAHEVGLPTSSTIMFGHMEQTHSWSRHLLKLLEIQNQTQGFTEFVPLPFVHMESPIYLNGGARRGPTIRETLLMHSVARLAFQNTIPNIQTSWVKMGLKGGLLSLNSGANDFGGVLMDETISRSAGAQNGSNFDVETMREALKSFDRPLLQRTTLYARPSDIYAG